MKFRDLPVGEYFRHIDGTGKFLKTATGSTVIEPLPCEDAIPVGEEAGFGPNSKVAPCLDQETATVCQ